MLYIYLLGLENLFFINIFHHLNKQQRILQFLGVLIKKTRVIVFINTLHFLPQYQTKYENTFWLQSTHTLTSSMMNAGGVFATCIIWLENEHIDKLLERL